MFVLCHIPYTEPLELSLTLKLLLVNSMLQIQLKSNLELIGQEYINRL